MAATPPVSKLKEKTTREGTGVDSGRPRPGHRRWRPWRLLPGLSVPSHARERSGRGNGRAAEAGEALSGGGEGR